jgi:polysaccharide chain length determinant protein (PEP-CTERM system associated)
VLSRTELERLIDQMGLYPADRARRPLQDVVERMRSDIVLDVIPSSSGGYANAFYVRFTYPDPEIATKVTERLGALFIDMNARDRGNLAQATNDFLKVQLAEARTRLEEQERKFKEFRDRNAGRLPSQLDFNMKSIDRMQMELRALIESAARDRDRKFVILERLYADAREEALAANLPTAQNRDPLDPMASVDGTAVEQLAAARETLARLEPRLQPEHPDIVRAKRLIQDLEARVTEESASVEPGLLPVTAPEQVARHERLSDMRAELAVLDQQIQAKEAEEMRVRGAIAEYERRVQLAPGLESEWTALNRDLEVTQAAYRSLLTRSEDAQVATDLEKRQIGEQYRILDPARVPVRPLGLDRIRVNAIGAVGGLFVGLLLAAFLEVRDRTYRTAEDVIDVLELPVLALVPHVTTDHDRRNMARRRLLTSSALALVVCVGAYGVWAMELWRHVR